MDILNLELNNCPSFSGKGDPPCIHYPPDMFFADLEGEPVINSTYLVNEAKRICYTCPYQMECLTYAVEEDLIGVWGGTSQRQRRQMAKDGKIFIPEIRIGKSRPGKGKASNDKN